MHATPKVEPHKLFKSNEIVLRRGRDKVSLQVVVSMDIWIED